MHNMCVCDQYKLLLRRNYFNYFTIKIMYYYEPYLYIHLSQVLLWNLYGICTTNRLF